MTLLASMFLLGLVGTGHCLGMCGPLVLALPFAQRGVRAHLGYHLGRLATYVVIGAAVAGLGAGLRHAAAGSGEDPMGTLARLQLVVSLVAALLLLGFGLARLGIVREPEVLSLASPSRVPGFEALRRRAAEKGGGAAVFGLGMLLGLLPCGLSYAAFARALPVADPLLGALMLGAFGLGTAPGLLVLGTGGSTVARRHRRLADLLAGVLLVGMAVSLGVDAARGLLVSG